MERDKLWWEVSVIATQPEGFWSGNSFQVLKLSHTLFMKFYSLALNNDAAETWKRRTSLQVSKQKHANQAALI